MNFPARSQILPGTTPLEYLPRLTARLKGPDIWVKRDDLTGLALGGNKLRKLEFFLRDAQEMGADCLITAGAIQSNHCRQTAAVAAKAGMKCTLVLTDNEPDELQANNLLDHLFGAELRWVGSQNREAALNETFGKLEEIGRRLYLVPYGGSNALGACGYIQAMRELAGQAENPFDWILFATSSGGTQAGMTLGLENIGWESQLLGISVDLPAIEMVAKVKSIADSWAEQYGDGKRVQKNQIRVTDEYLGAGYARMGQPEKEAIELFAREEALLLDPVYTGRAAAGLIDLIRRGEIRQGEKLLFWHTGGTPALFDPKYAKLLN